MHDVIVDRERLVRALLDNPMMFSEVSSQSLDMYLRGAMELLQQSDVKLTAEEELEFLCFPSDDPHKWEVFIEQVFGDELPDSFWERAVGTLWVFARSYGAEDVEAGARRLASKHHVEIKEK